MHDIVNEKSRFYRMAKRSATESAAVFDIAKRLNIIQEENYQAGRTILIRIVSMLTKMAQRTELPGKGTLTGPGT